MYRRHFIYLTGTRADFGLMRRCLLQLQQEPSIKLSLIVCGMHLDPHYGATVKDIEASGLTIALRLHHKKRPRNGAAMAHDMADWLAELTDGLAELAPDGLILLGDRGEMLAGALAALHLNIPIIHLHGGERSGTIDESIRHAISKLAHLHLVSCEAAKQRLIKMGENENHIFITGAPGLDGVVDDAHVPRAVLFDQQNFDATKKVALLLYHPVVQESDKAAESTAIIVDFLMNQGVQILALAPNSDAASANIEAVLSAKQKEYDKLKLITHFPRATFLSWLKHATLLVGNSSSGIVEAASFGLAVINIGSRQHLRERNPNVFDCEAAPEALAAAWQKALRFGAEIPKEQRFLPYPNLYGDGKAGQRIVTILRDFPFDPTILAKSNGY